MAKIRRWHHRRQKHRKRRNNRESVTAYVKRRRGESESNRNIEEIAHKPSISVAPRFIEITSGINENMSKSNVAAI